MLDLTSPATAAIETTPAIAVPLQIHDRCQVQWREEQGEFLDAIVVHRRPRHHRKRKNSNNSKKNEATIDLDSLPAEELEYYVHYINHDRYVFVCVHVSQRVLLR